MAVRCGTAVIGMMYAMGMPAAAPIRMAETIHAQLCTLPMPALPPGPGNPASVPATASSMPSSPANTPRREVEGWFIHFNARMNNAAETM